MRYLGIEVDATLEISEQTDLMPLVRPAASSERIGLPATHLARY